MTNNQSESDLPDIACVLNDVQSSITPSCISPSTSVIQTKVCWIGTTILTSSFSNSFSKTPSQSTPTLLPSPSPDYSECPSGDTLCDDCVLDECKSSECETYQPYCNAANRRKRDMSTSCSFIDTTLTPIVTSSVLCTTMSSIYISTTSAPSPSPSPTPSPQDYTECPSGDSQCQDCVLDDECESSECVPYQPYCDAANRKRKRDINYDCSTVTIITVPSLTFSLNCPTLPSLSQSLSPSLSTQSPSPSLSTQSPLPSLSTQSPLPSLSTQSPLPSLSTQSPLPSLSTQSPSPSLSTQSPLPSLSTQSPSPSLSTQSPLPSLSTPSPSPIPPDYSECPSGNIQCEDCLSDDCAWDFCPPYQPYCDHAVRRKRDINSNETDKSCSLDIWIVNDVTTLAPNATTCLNPSSLSHSTSQYPSSTLISTSSRPTPTSNTLPQSPSCKPINVILVGRFYILSHSYVDCQPKNDPFNPCDDIIDSNLLRAAIWLVILLSLGGNVIVITITSSYFISRYRTHNKQPHLMYFLYINLAIADLFMGIYLLTIAIVDLDTLGEYSLHAVEWQTGPGCRFAGFCAIFSSLLSVYTLLVITIERVYSIKFALQHKQFKKRYAAIIMSIGWIIAIILSILPMLNVSSYERVSICLPFDTRDTIDKVYVVFILVITGIASFVILLSYVILFYLVTCSRNKKDLHGTLSGREEMKLAFRMSLLIITDFACWGPIAFFGLTAAFKNPLIDVSGAKILMVIVFPINSCLNPLLYSFSTRKFRSTLYSIFNRCGLCAVCNRHLKAQSSGAFIATPSEENNNIEELKQYYRTRRRSTQMSIMTHLLSLTSASSDHGSRRGSAFSSGSDDTIFQNGSARTGTPPVRPERVSEQSLTSEESLDLDPSDMGGRVLRDQRPSLASLGHISQLTALPEEAEEDITMEVIQNTKVHRDSNTSAESTVHLQLNYTPVRTETFNNQNEDIEYEETSFNGRLEDGLCETNRHTVPSVYKNDGYLDDVWPMTADMSLQVNVDDAFSHKSSQESPSPTRKAILPVLLPVQINYDEHNNESQCQKVVFY